MSDAQSKLAVITGSTGGLGAEMAKLLAERGWDLVLVNRSADKGAAQARQLAAAGRTVETVTADLLDVAEVKRAAAEIAAAHPRIDALYNNSGVLTEKKVMSPAGVESHFAINTLAPYVMAEGLREPLAAAAAAGGEPMVVNISSAIANMAKNVDVAALPNPDKIGKLTGAYANSKLAVTAVSAFMKDELEARGIRIRAIEPGGVKTKMTMKNDDAMPWWAKLVAPVMFKPADVQARKVVDLADPAALGGATGVFVGINGKIAKTPAQAADPMFQGQLRALLDQLAA